MAVKIAVFDCRKTQFVRDAEFAPIVGKTTVAVARVAM